MKKTVIAAMAAGLVIAPTPLLVTTAPVAGAWCNPWFPASCYFVPQVPQYRPPQFQVPHYQAPQVPQYHPPAPQVPQYHPPQAPQYHPPQAPQYHPPQAPQPQHPQVPQPQHPQVPQQHPEQVPQQHPGQQQVPGVQPHPGQPQLPGQQLHPGQQPQQVEHPGQPQLPGQQLHPGQPQLPGQQLHPGQPQLPGQQLHPGGTGPGKTAVVSSPKGLGADPKAIAAAKAAPQVRIKPATPPKAPTHVDFNHQVQNVIGGHGHNLDVVKAGNHELVRPRHWDYLDYDRYHRPVLYNPINEAMTFRYFYDGAYRDLWIPAGGQMVLDAVNGGVYPFTAVGDNYLTAGSFDGGGWSPPDGWDGPAPADYVAPQGPMTLADVTAYVPAEDQSVQVGKVTMMGHDDNQPAGSQDAFMLNDTTLAWGQANDPHNGGKITVTKSQALPGVGPIDNGSSLVTLAAHDEPMRPSHNWLPWTLGGLLASALGVGAWVARRFHRKLEVTPSTSSAV
jgi:hypothetical protein